MVAVYSAVDVAIKREYDTSKRNVDVNLCGVVKLNVKCVIINVKNIFVIESENWFVNGDKNCSLTTKVILDFFLMENKIEERETEEYNCSVKKETFFI